MYTNTHFYKDIQRFLLTLKIIVGLIFQQILKFSFHDETFNGIAFKNLNIS